MHPSKTESLPNPLDISSVAQECSKNNITQKAFSVDNTFRRSIYSKDRNLFARQGYLSMNINFTPDQQKELMTFLEQTEASGKSKVDYHDGHYGYQIGKEQLDRLPHALRHALVPQDLLQNVEFYFGEPGSITLLAFEAHGVKNGSPEQGPHADVNLGDESAVFSREEILRLAVTCIISVNGPVNTMVYPRTAAKVMFEDDLDGIPCIRATESNNCVLFDAALVHKGAANYSGKPTLRIVITFMNNSASKKQASWVVKCTDIKTLLYLSVNEFLGQRATDCDWAVAAGSAAAAVSSARSSQEATHSAAVAATTATAADAADAGGTVTGDVGTGHGAR
jgi:hypothetical protein